MAEFLSMTMLNAEPVSAPKPQAMQSNDVATAPDQRFADTLAAEVNGKTSEKSAKAPAKTRQNNASEATDSEATAVADAKNDDSKPGAVKDPALSDEEELVSETPESVLAENEKGETEQSHWLNLLEKAKSLQDRLSKAETDNKAGADKASSAMDSLAAQATSAKQHSDKTKVADLSDAETIALAKAKTGELKDGAIVLDEKLMAEQRTEQHLTAEELKALKLMAQTDKNSAGKTQAADIALKQQTPAEADLALTESKDKAAVQSLLSSQKDQATDQSKTIASVEKSLKATVQTTQAVEVEKQTAIETEVLATATPVNKAQVQSEQAATLLKGNAAATAGADESVEIDDDKGRETLTAHSVATDPKTSVQAQSAAALVAPAAQHNKAASSEAKVTTEDVLKQMQTAAAANQGEQGASSSSGEPSQQGTAETILTVIEQQKGSNPVVSEANSFSSQLKSSLEKTNAGITVAGRETVSDASQKQVDQLGQKLNLIQPEASNQLKEKMLMMVKDKVHTAEIRLDPSELGSMQIKISLQQDQMSVQFMVQQGNAKELMEQQMPKLKELLQQQGIELSQGSVQQQNQSSSGQEGGRRTAGGNGMGTTSGSSDELVEPGLLPTKNSDRVVDYYA